MSVMTADDDAKTVPGADLQAIVRDLAAQLSGILAENCVLRAQNKALVEALEAEGYTQ